MSTVAEIDSKGRVVRIFHRTPTAAWTHVPGEKYRYWGGRHGEPKWLPMTCPCPLGIPGVGDGPEAVLSTATATEEAS